jgi:hypothetical protein
MTFAFSSLGKLLHIPLLLVLLLTLQKNEDMDAKEKKSVALTECIHTGSNFACIMLNKAMGMIP